MSQLQLDLFKYIKSIVPAHVSLADEVACVLNISLDSAYRRIRGEKQISFEEIQKLASYFKISIDQVLNLQNNSILFFGNFIEPGSFDFPQYLEDIYAKLAYINSFDKKELIFFAKDSPIYYYSMFPELLAFKFFVWSKTLFNFPDYQHSKFNLKEIKPELVEKAKKVATIACQIPAIEILNVQNIEITMKQIEYYKDTSFFASRSDTDTLYEKIHELTDHLENICAEGKKFLPLQKPPYSGAQTKMYVNDFVPGDNSCIAILNEKKACFVAMNVVNLIRSQDERLCNYTYNFMQNVISKSDLITGVGEKGRTIFFNAIRRSIESYKKTPQSGKLY